MEFHEKLQKLRKSKGLTQEELACALYVSRAAVSKWESGRGYPNMDSLRAISAYFSVTVDELLCTDCLQKQTTEESTAKKEGLALWVLLDLCAPLLLLLPLFAHRSSEGATACILLALDNDALWLKVLAILLATLSAFLGALQFTRQKNRSAFLFKNRFALSLILGGLSVLLFIAGLQPYAAAFSFLLLTVKVLGALKKQ